MRAGFDLWGVNESPDAIASVRYLARSIAPGLEADRFCVEPVEAMSLDDGSMDIVISSAVLHFARDEAHWDAMVHEIASMGRASSGGDSPDRRARRR